MSDHQPKDSAAMLKIVGQDQNDHNINDPAARIVTHHLFQLRAITIIRMLVPLLIASQQHRGANLALLEGNEQFADKVGALQREINNRFLTLEAINKEFAEPISNRDMQRLKQEWDTVRDWYGGTALENFKLHSHFIEQQMQLIWLLIEKTNHFAPLSSLPDSWEDTRMSPSESTLTGDSLLIWFVLRETPELIELIAKIRGLATHASILAFCDEEHHLWLEYLLKLLNQKKEKFREHSKALQPYVLEDVPAIIDLHIQDIKIVQLIQLISEKILYHKQIVVEGYDIFNMATNIIESYSVVFEQGLSYIRNKINKQLDNWHLDF